jgi:hypothetical protein
MLRKQTEEGNSTTTLSPVEQFDTDRGIKRDNSEIIFVVGDSQPNSKMKKDMGFSKTFLNKTVSDSH